MVRYLCVYVCVKQKQVAVNVPPLPMKVGDTVSGQWREDDGNMGEWYPGRIESINTVNQTIHIVFDDGDQDTALPWGNVILIT